MLSAECSESVSADAVLLDIKSGNLKRFETLLKEDSLASIPIQVHIASILISAEHPDRSCYIEALRVLQQAANHQILTIPVVLALLASTLEVTSRGIKLQNAAFDILPNLLVSLRKRGALEMGRGKLSTVCIASGFLVKLLTGPVHKENILPLVLALREISNSLNDQTLSPLLKKLEDVPAKNLPAAIYQTLYWCRESPKDHRACFETIFLVIESQAQQIDIRECLEYIRLALFHEHTLMESFIKESKALMRLGSSVSPCVLLLLLESEDASCLDKKIKSVEKYLTEIIAIKLSVQNLISMGSLDSHLASWPTSADKILNRLMDIVQPDDETSIKSLINLSLALLASKKLSHPQLSECSAELGKSLMKKLYEKFSSAREEILRSLIQQLLLVGAQWTTFPTWHQNRVETLNEVLGQTADSGFLIKYLLMNPNRTSLFCESLSKAKGAPPVNIIKSLAGSTDVLHDLIQSHPSLVLQSISLQLLNCDRSIPHFFSLLDRALVADCATKISSYDFFTFICQDLSSAAASNLAFDLCYINYQRIFPTDKSQTDWTQIVLKCVDVSCSRLAEPLPLLLQCMLDTKATGNEKWLEFVGRMDCLCETVCNPINWFPLEIPMASQLVLRPVIIGLYDIALECFVLRGNLDDRSLGSACSRLLEMRAKFISEFPTLATNEYEIVNVRTAVEALSRSVPTSVELAESLPSALLAIPWDMKDMTPTDIISLLKCQRRALGSPNPDFFELMITNELPSKELSLMSDILKSVTQKSDSPSARGCEKLWAILKTWICTSEADASVAKSLVSALLHTASTDSMAALTAQLSKDVLLVQGGIKDGASEELGQRMSRILLKALCNKSVGPILNSLLGFIADALSKCDDLVHVSIKVGSWSARDAGSIGSHAINDLLWIASSSAILCEAQITGPNHIMLMKILITLFRITSNLCKLLRMYCNLPLLETLTPLAQLLAGSVTANIYELLPGIQQAELGQINEAVAQKKEKRQKLMTRLGSKIAREARLIPDLIFQIEVFERSITDVATKFGVTIVKSFYRSTARDFRIQVDELDDRLGTSSDNDNSSADNSQSEINGSRTVEGADFSLVISNQLEE